MSYYCSRSHPHENMDDLCQLKTDIDRLINENSRLKHQKIGTWSTEKPTRPGWYWWRQPYCQDVIVEITLGGAKNGKRLYVVTDGDTGELASFSGEWAGPIPEPEER